MSLPLPLRLRLRELQRFSAHTNEEAAEIEALNQVTELVRAASGYYARHGNCGPPIDQAAADRLIAALTPFEETAP